MAVTAIRVEAAVPGRRRAGTAEHPLALPIPEGGTIVLRDFIDAVVRAEIASFHARAGVNSVLRVLTERQIAEGLETGAIRSGDSEAATDVDDDAAVATALLAFEDGLYSVLVDDEPIESLEAAITVRPDMRLLFLRLVALAGG